MTGVVRTTSPRELRRIIKIFSIFLIYIRYRIKARYPRFFRTDRIRCRKSQQTSSHAIHLTNIKERDPTRKQ
jgi:uncharacterized membrane protein